MFSSFSRSSSNSENESVVLLGNSNSPKSNNIKDSSKISKSVLKLLKKTFLLKEDCLYHEETPLTLEEFNKNTSHVNSWKKLLVQLYNDKIEYYSTKRDENQETKKGKLLKSISLEKGQLVTKAPERSLTKNFCFKFITHQRSYYFIAPNENKMEEWIKSINKAINDLPEEESEISPIEAKSSAAINPIQSILDKFPENISASFRNEYEQIVTFPEITYHEPNLLTLNLPGTLYILKEYLLFYSKIMSKETIFQFHKSELSVISVEGNSFRFSIPNKGTYLFSTNKENNPNQSNIQEPSSQIDSIAKELKSKFGSTIIKSKNIIHNKEKEEKSAPNLNNSNYEAPPSPARSKDTSTSFDETSDGIISEGFSDESNNLKKKNYQYHMNLDTEIKINSKFRAIFNNLYQKINKDVFQKNLPESELIQIRFFCYYKDDEYANSFNCIKNDLDVYDSDISLTVNEEHDPLATFSPSRQSSFFLYGETYVTNNYIWFCGRYNFNSPRVLWVIPLENIENIFFTDCSIKIQTYSDRGKSDYHFLYLFQDQTSLKIKDNVLKLENATYFNLKELSQYPISFSTQFEIRNFGILIQLYNTIYKPPISVLIPTIDQERYTPLQYRIKLYPDIDGVSTFSEYLSQENVFNNKLLKKSDVYSINKNQSVKLISNYFTSEYLDKHKSDSPSHLRKDYSTMNQPKFDIPPYCSVISFFSLQCFRSWGKQNIHLVILQNFQNGDMTLQLIQKGKSKPFKTANFKDMACVLRDHKDKSIFYISFGTKKKWKFQQSDPEELQKIVSMLDRINKQANVEDKS